MLRSKIILAEKKRTRMAIEKEKTIVSHSYMIKMISTVSNIFFMKLVCSDCVIFVVLYLTIFVLALLHVQGLTPCLWLLKN